MFLLTFFVNQSIYIKIINMEKMCNKHGLTEYTIRSDGNYRCKKCAVEAVQKRRDNIKILSVEYKGGKCENTECGYNKYVGALEFHHTDNNKDFGIASKGYTRSWESVKDELDKCVMLCANCHREVHGGILDISRLSSSNHKNPTQQLKSKNESEDAPVLYNNHVTITQTSKTNKCIDCGIEIGVEAVRCFKCYSLTRRKVTRPSFDELSADINILGYSGTGKKHGVSDNSIRKWIKFYKALK